MSAPLPTYLKTYRKRSGLSQDELAFLLGCRSGAKVSRYEQFARQPNLSTVFAYEVIFRASACDLFAGIYRQVERATLARARQLARRLQTSGADGRLTARKLAALRSLGAAPADNHRRS